MTLPIRHPAPGVVALSLAIVGLAACGGEEETTPEPAEATSGDEAPPASAQRMVDITPETDDAGDGVECDLETVFFAFDSDQLDPDARDAIARAVACYREHGMPARLHLTGAADPRGTEEYNLALGEKRAEAVERYLVSLGVGDERVSVSSVGEELASGTDEPGWARDRRVSVSED